MTHSSSTMSRITVGLDVGDRRTHYCAVDGNRKVLQRGVFATSRTTLADDLRGFTGAKIVFEAGSQSPWMSWTLRGGGFDVQVVDPRRVKAISEDPRKSDRRDAETLAKLAAGVPELVGDVHHRGEQAQAHMAVLRVRDLMVRLRTQAVQATRGICKNFGERLPSTSVEAFPRQVAERIPELIRRGVLSVLELIDEFNRRIRALDKSLAAIAKEHYPEVERLQQVNGVGPVISLAFVLSIEDPKRFKKSRQVGSWVGLCPRSRASGDSTPQLSISKAGDRKLRRLLNQGAQYILGPFGKDSDLRRYGLKIVERGGKAPKKRAVVAVARKLAVLLHRLWVTGADYEPLRNANRKALLAT